MNIQARLILTLSTLALALVLGIVVLFQWRFDVGLVDYLNAQQDARMRGLAEELAERWQDDPGWQRLRAEPRQFFRLARRLPERDGHHEHRAHGKLPPPGPVVLLDAQQRLLIGKPDLPVEPEVTVPVRVNGQVVGYVGAPRFQTIENDIDRHFREAQLRSLWFVAAFALLVAVLAAVLLARQITRPLRQLSQAAHRLTQQQYGIEVDAARRDELGALARDMQELARTLASNADARQRWFADISHELRTPLAVLLGEIDSLLDGVRPLTRERVESLQQEVRHLQRLVDDLYVLARADLGALQYHKGELDLAELLRERLRAAGGSLAEASLSLQASLPATEVTVFGDEDRLQQLLDNLLANSVRYTDAGGTVQVSLAVQDGAAQLVVEDSAPGVPAAALPRLFDHLFRVDAARTRSAGGAGLGLAIARRIVEAHGGSIDASDSALGGLRMRVRLPLAGGTAA